jgi:hypothetical protein
MIELEKLNISYLLSGRKEGRMDNIDVPLKVGTPVKT